MYLLDTNICIYIIKKKSPEILRHLKSKIDKGIFISTLTVAELDFGVEKSLYQERNRIALIEFLSLFNTMPYTNQAAMAYGKLRAHLEHQGKTIGSIDLLLASQALAADFIFVTNNTSEFKRVPNLKIENWVH